MFGGRFWGNRYYGGRYWGHAGAEPPPPAPAPEVTDVSGAFYGAGARLTERLTEDEWRRLLYRPDELLPDELERRRMLEQFMADEELIVLIAAND